MAETNREAVQRRPAFTHLTEQEEHEVCQGGSTKDLAPGSKLESGLGDLFLVLDGSVRLLRSAAGASLHSATLRPGDWWCASAASKTAVVAEGASSLLVVPRVDSLSPAVQGKIHQRMCDMANRQAQYWAERAVSYHQKTRHLSSYVRDLRVQAHEESLHSDIVQSVLRRVPRLPVYVTELLTLLHDHDVADEEVVRWARQDPSLVAELLKVVNSAAFGFDQKIADVHHAVMLLGFNRVAQIVIGMGVAQTMPNTEDFKEILNHSIAIAHMAYEIGRLGRVERPALMSTVALLGDVGKSLLMLLKRSFEKMDVFFEFFDPARIGALLLRHWDLPEAIWRGVELQRLPEFCPPTDVPETCRTCVTVVHLARLCDAYLQGREDKDLTVGFFAEYFRLIPLPEDSISDLVNKHLLRTLRKEKSKRVFSA